MARKVGHEVAAKVVTKQGEVTEEIEDLVACRLVGMGQPVVDRPIRAKDQKVRRGRSRSQALTSQFFRFCFEDKGAATGHFCSEGLGSNDLCVTLTSNRGLEAVIEGITNLQSIVVRRME